MFKEDEEIKRISDDLSFHWRERERLIQALLTKQVDRHLKWLVAIVVIYVGAALLYNMIDW